MKKRKPSTQPQPGDVLTHSGWTIRVVEINKNGGIVYTATKGEATRNGVQGIEEWSGWSRKVKVLEVALAPSECVPTASVAGFCEVGGHAIEGVNHCIDLKLYCEGHCPRHA